MQTRYYDPEARRFISQDDIDYADPETINGLNLYAYCGNNPVMNVDPNGNFFFLFLIGLIVGAVVGSAVAYKTAKENGASGWELLGWTLLGLLGGAIIGGAAGAIIGAGASIIGSGLSMLSASGGVLALASGGTAAAGALAGLATVGLGTIVLGGGLAVAKIGFSILYASIGRPGDNRKQNEQVRAAIRELGNNPNDPKIKDIINDVEKYIRQNKLNLGYRDLLELLMDFLP